MKKSTQVQSRGRKSRSKQSRRTKSRTQRSRTRKTTPIEPAVVVGTTQEARPRLVVKRPVTLAEAIAEPVIDIAKEKPVSVRKVARRAS